MSICECCINYLCLCICCKKDKSKRKGAPRDVNGGVPEETEKL